MGRLQIIHGPTPFLNIVNGIVFTAMEPKAIKTGAKYPTENCRYLARDGFYYKNQLLSPDALRRDASTRVQEYVQRPKSQYVPKK